VPLKKWLKQFQPHHRHAGAAGRPPISSPCHLRHIIRIVETYLGQLLRRRLLNPPGNDTMLGFEVLRFGLLNLVLMMELKLKRSWPGGDRKDAKNQPGGSNATRTPPFISKNNHQPSLRLRAGPGV
jgi:hypothetical protein